MSIQIPSEVVFLLNMLGLPYPDINADQVRELAQHVRDFATDVRETHESATGVVNDMGSVYSGDSYQALLAAWARMSSGNMAQLDAACNVVATALDVAADVIEAVQVAVLAELAALAVTYTAIMFTPAGVAARPLIDAVARRLLSSLQETLVWYIAAEVLGKAIEPLEDKIEQMINGTLYDAASDALGVTPGSAKQMHIEPDEVLRYAKVLDDHADAMLSHAEKFADKVARLDFTTPGLNLPDGEGPPGVPGSPAALPPGGVEPPERFAQPSPSPDVVSSPSPETQRPLTATPSANSPGSDPAATDGQRGNRGVDQPGSTAPAADAGRPATAPSAGESPAEPGRAASAPDTHAGRAELDEAGRNPADSGSPASDRAVQSPQRAESSPLLERPGGIADMAPAATANTASSLSADTAPWARGQTPSAIDPNEQHPAATAAGPAGPTGQAQSGTDRPSARPVANNRQQPSRSQAAQTPWSRAGRAVARVASAAKRSRKAPAISAGQTGDREQPAETPWSKAGSPRDTDAQVFVPDTAPPSVTAPPAVSAPPAVTPSGKTGTSDRDREAPAGPPAKAVEPPVSADPPPTGR